MSYYCDICLLTSPDKRDHNKHLNTAKHKAAQELARLSSDKTNLILEENNQIREEQEGTLRLLEDKDRIIDKLNAKIESLQEKSDEFKSIVEKAATRPTIVNNFNGNTKIINNILQILSPYPLDQALIDFR